MELRLDNDDAAVLRRVLRGLLPQLQQEAYASENSPDITDWSTDERAVKHIVETLEARLSNQKSQDQQQG